MPRVQQDELVHVDGAVAVHVCLQYEGVDRSLRLYRVNLKTNQQIVRTIEFYKI